MVTNYALYIITGIFFYLIGSYFYLFNIENTLLLGILFVNLIVNFSGMKTKNTNSLVLESSLVLSRRPRLSHIFSDNP